MYTWYMHIISTAIMTVVIGWQLVTMVTGGYWVIMFICAAETLGHTM